MLKLILINVLVISIVTTAGEREATDSEDDESTNNNDEFITKTEEKLFSSIFRNYSSRVRPCGVSEQKSDEAKSAGSCGPTNVKVFVYLRAVDDVDDKAMNFDMQLIFRQIWKDHRLAYKRYLTDDYDPAYLTVSPDEKQFKIWVPDTFFVNEKEGYRHEIDKENVMIRISPKGEVTYSFRVTLTLACRMDFRQYPRDKHKCTMDISSYSHTVQNILYEWRDSSAILMSSDFKNNVADFEFEQVKREYCRFETTTGAYSCLRLGLYFKRIFNYAQFCSLYLPGFALVCVSWLCFWMSVQAMVTRSTFGLFCFLTFIIQYAIVSPTFPPASTYRSVDAWFTVCLVFLVLGMVQLVVVYRITRSELRQAGGGDYPTTGLGLGVGGGGLGGGASQVQSPAVYLSSVPDNESPLVGPPMSKGSTSKLQPKRSVALPKKSMILKTERRLSNQQDTVQVSPLLDDMKDKDDENQLMRTKPNPVIRKWRKCSKSQKFDVLCRVFFPVAFFFFNIIYWSHK